MPRMADKQHMPAEPPVAHCLLVDLRNQRAGGMQIKEVARFSIRGNRLRHAVGREDHRAMAMVCGTFGQPCYEERAKILQPVHPVSVMHDLMADIDWRTVFLQRKHDDLDGTVDPGAKSARLAKPYRQGRFSGGLQHVSWLINRPDMGCVVRPCQGHRCMGARRKAQQRLMLLLSSPYEPYQQNTGQRRCEPIPGDCVLQMAVGKIDNGHS